MENEQDLSETIEEKTVIEEVITEEDKAEDQELSKWQKLEQLIQENHQKTMTKILELETKITPVTPVLEVETITPTETEMEAEILNLSTNPNNQQNGDVVDHEKTVTRKAQRQARKQGRKVK